MSELPHRGRQLGLTCLHTSCQKMHYLLMTNASVTQGEYGLAARSVRVATLKDEGREMLDCQCRDNILGDGFLACLSYHAKCRFRVARGQLPRGHS